MMYNVFICHDLLRHYDMKTIPRCLMNVDLRKAYDMISWEFLVEVLKGYRFHERFIVLLIIYVTTPKYIVQINGEGHGFLHGKRGLKQGDPISLLLFILVMKYLSRNFKYMSRLPEFKFHPICKGVELTHLIFVDDLMIFVRQRSNLCVELRRLWITLVLLQAYWTI